MRTVTYKICCACKQLGRAILFDFDGSHSVCKQCLITMYYDLSPTHLNRALSMVLLNSKQPDGASHVRKVLKQHGVV